MGKPKEAKKATVDTNYNWGDFGSANESGVNLSDTASNTVQSTQSGIGQYLPELMNPSTSNESFIARQNIMDANNRAYAEDLARNAMAKGYRGSVLDQTLNSLQANRNNELAQNLIGESSRLQNILSALSGVESNYFNQADTMRSNILQRQQGNQGIEQDINKLNTAGYNAWKSNALSGAANIAGSLAGAYGSYLDSKQSPYTFVNGGGGTSTVYPGHYTEIDLNTMQPVG